MPNYSSEAAFQAAIIDVMLYAFGLFKGEEAGA